LVGHSAIANAEPDGYTLGIVTVEIGMIHWAGLTELTHEDYTPLGRDNEDPAGVQVRADAAWKTIEISRQRKSRTPESESDTRSVPLSRISPCLMSALSGSNLSKESAIEVLPQPDSPTNPIDSPCPTEKFTFSTA
jgi:hypothetical protein